MSNILAPWQIGKYDDKDFSSFPNASEHYEPIFMNWYGTKNTYTFDR